MPKRSKRKSELLCFVVCPIGDPASEHRRRSDGILREIIQPAVAELGFRVERADHDKSPGIVTDTIMSKVLDADLVVADLTGLNPNVMYEVALRHAVNRPVVQMIEQGNKLPFDIQGVNTIFFQATLEGRQEAVAHLKSAAAIAVKDTSIGNPVLRAFQFKALRTSDLPASKLLADALEEMRALASQIRSDAQVESHRRRQAERDVRAWLESQLLKHLRMDHRIDEIEDSVDAVDWHFFYRDGLVIVVLIMQLELVIGAAVSATLEDTLDADNLAGMADFIAEDLIDQAHRVLDRLDERTPDTADTEAGTAHGG
jgi:hypothetical protein